MCAKEGSAYAYRRPPHRYRGASSALPSMLPVSNRFLYLEPQRNTSARHTPRLFNVPSSLRQRGQCSHWEGHSCALRLRCSKGYSLIDDRNRDCPMCIYSKVEKIFFHKCAILCECPDSDLYAHAMASASLPVLAQFLAVINIPRIAFLG